MVGESVLVRRPTLRVMQNIARKVGVKVTQKLVGKGIARWLPVLGALGVGAYAYYETGRVAATAIGLFEKSIDVESSVSPVEAIARRKPMTASAGKKGNVTKVRKIQPTKTQTTRKRAAPPKN